MKLVSVWGAKIGFATAMTLKLCVLHTYILSDAKSVHTSVVQYNTSM